MELVSEANWLKVFENRILRRIFGPKGDASGEQRRFHNEQLHSLYRSPSIVRVIKSRRSRWAGHVARTAFKLLTISQLSIFLSISHGHMTGLIFMSFPLELSFEDFL